MARAIDDYNEKRRRLIGRLVDQMARDRGLAVSAFLPQPIRQALEHDAWSVYEVWLARVSDSQREINAESIEGLFGELYSLERVMHELLETGNVPRESVH